MANYDLTYEGSRVQGILDTGNSLKDAGYIFRGEATPSTVPGTPTERVAYIGGPGTYNNFGGSITVGAGCICVFKYTGSAWSNQVINTGLSDAISSAINSEATTRSEADTALQNAISSEATTRSEADTALQNAISSEATTRSEADTALQNAISSEATTRSEADTALQNAITAINNNIGNGYVFAGVAIPSTSPVTGKVFYLAVTAGTYTNFEDSEETPLAVTAGINILKNTGTGWVLDQVIAIDTEPTQGSANLVKSGGVLNSIIQNGPAFDLSAYNAQGGVLATYTDLSAALTALDALPADFKKGGMSFKFVLTSDNKYVQYRLMADEFSTTPANWQGVDDEPTAGSKNLAESGGIADKYGDYISNSDFVEIKTDSESKILEARDPTGKKIIYTDLEVKGNILNTEKGKSLINTDFASAQETINHPDWYEVTLDKDKKILEGINTKGEKVINIPIKSPSLDALKGNVLNGKKYAFCGDSFTAALFNNITDPQGRTGIDSPELYDQVRRMWKSYGWWIIDRNNMSYYKDGVSGSRMTAVYNGGVIQNTDAFCYQRYLNIPKDTDYLTLMFGLNEISVTIGDESSNDDSTLWGAYNKVLEYFLTEMPSMKIGIIISDAWLINTPVAEAIKAIAKYWGIPYLDMGGDEHVPMRINGKSYSVSTVAKQLRNARFQISALDSHPNQYAHEYMSTYVENFLRTL